MINGRTRLHVVANGTMTGQQHIDEVLLPHVRLFRGAVGDKFVFMDDNATCHRTLAVQDCLDSEGIQRLVWPARSPDLNPIENVWDALRWQVAGRNYPPTNKNNLIRALTVEWDKLPQQLLDNVVQSMIELLDLKSKEIRCSKFKCLYVELEILEKKKCDLSSQHKWSTLNDLEKEDLIIFNAWNSIPDSYDQLKKLAFAILSLFDSTCICEQSFSSLNIIKSKLRSRLIDENLE
ncbi:transposable element Tc1 transposase [Trichonephila clavipes]|nr:transposable element Tc1 transposase [Trichonephila clavipes]